MSPPATTPATVRFYFDEDALGLGRLVAGLRGDATYPGDPGGTVHGRQRPPCPLRPGRPDREWMPTVAVQSWLVVTRDPAVERHPAAIHAVRRYGLRMVAIAGRDARGTWDQLEVLLTHWRLIDTLPAAPGPFLYRLTRRGRPQRVPLG